MGENMSEYCSLLWSSVFKKGEFRQEHVQVGEGEGEASFYKERLQQPMHLVQLQPKRFAIFLPNKDKIQDRKRSIYDKG